MRRLLPLLMLCASTGALAQSADTAYNAHDFLDINNLRARVNALGDMWWDPASTTVACEYPAGSGKNIAATGAIWMSAYDAGGGLRVAAQTYRQNGLDFWTGPTQTIFSEAEGTKWGRIWKVNKADINLFLSLPTHTLENTPASILEWPAYGNPYAKGAEGVPLTVFSDMAPFVDVDEDGSYNPLMGDYPAIKGDQMLWNVYTDGVDNHTESGGTPLKVTIRQSSYAYDASGTLGNILFYEYDITNQSNTSYDSFRLAFLADMDLGDAFNDYVGFDSARRMGIVFNGTSTDPVYGTEIPAAAIAILEAPGDAPGMPVPVSFAMYNNDFSVTGSPETPADYNHYIRGRNKAGEYLNYDSTYQINWSVPGGSTYECDSATLPNDRRFLISTGDTTFAAGATHKYVFALVVAPNAGGCPAVDLTGIADAVDTAITVHDAPTGIAMAPAPASIKLYPNPATQEINFSMDQPLQRVAAINTLGQSIDLPYRQENGRIVAHVSQLPAGVYTLSVSGKNYRQNAVFVKQ